MSKKKFFVDILRVLFSRVLSLLSGVVVGFVLPKVLGVTDYGFLRIYTLYTVYTALMHFGFIDGILLKFAGFDYKNLDKTEMRTYSRFFISFQLILSFAFIIVAVLFFETDYRFIIIMLGLNLSFNNIMTYYQFISQATQRFKEYSNRSIIVAVAKTALVLIMLLLYRYRGTELSYQPYIIWLNIIDFALLIWYVFTYRDITFGKRKRLKECNQNIKSLFKKGIILTIAYQAAQLALALDRQFVSVLFTTKMYGLYSFAYSLVSMISQLISSISTVMFPTLKKVSKGNVLTYYKPSVSIVSMISGGALLGYFPLQLFIQWYLPEYTGSLDFLKIILPTLVFTSCISVVLFTFYKVLDKNMVYLKCAVITLVVGFILNYVAYMFFKTPQAISWASLVTIIIWYIIAGIYFVKCGQVFHIKSIVYISLLSLAFYMIVNFITNMFICSLLYIVSFVLITLLIYKKSVFKEILSIR